MSYAQVFHRNELLGESVLLLRSSKAGRPPALKTNVPQA